jgi:hypothetical protein
MATLSVAHPAQAHASPKAKIEAMILIVPANLSPTLKSRDSETILLLSRFCLKRSAPQVRQDALLSLLLLPQAKRSSNEVLLKLRAPQGRQAALHSLSSIASSLAPARRSSNEVLLKLRAPQGRQAALPSLSSIDLILHV